MRRVSSRRPTPSGPPGLCDPVALGPTMVWRTGNIRQPGATARVNFALSGLPAFHGGDPERLAGRIVIGPSIDDVERAMDAVKYGHVSEEPTLEATIPSLTDPSLAPEGKHVMSVVFQAAPYAPARGRLGHRTRPRRRHRDQDARALRARVRRARRGARGDHARSTWSATTRSPVGTCSTPSRRSTSSSRGVRCSGEARYGYLLDGLYLAGSGAHPGGGITGGPGANAARQILKDRKK